MYIVFPVQPLATPRVYRTARAAATAFVRVASSDRNPDIDAALMLSDAHDNPVWPSVDEISRALDGGRVLTAALVEHRMLRHSGALPVYRNQTLGEWVLGRAVQ